MMDKMKDMKIKKRTLKKEEKKRIRNRICDSRRKCRLYI